METTTTRRQLLERGMTDRQIRAAVERGQLWRLRVGHYARPDVDPAVAAAVRAGGRLACVSELRARGVWVLDSAQIHVEVPSNASRLPSSRARLHWSADRVVDRAGSGDHVGVLAALGQASRCLRPLAWLASVESARHQSLLAASEIPMLRKLASPRSRRLLNLVDARADSGLETIVRVIAHELGFRVRSQVRVPGVGRVDLIVESWIAVETDGTEFHDVSLSPRDRRRDAQLAARGMTALRPGYSLIVFDRAAVARQLIGAVAAHRRVKDSGHLAARARKRLAGLDLS